MNSEVRKSSQGGRPAFQDLVVWQRAIELSLEVYRYTADFPPEKRFGLTAQLRRAAVSVASNIAEGYGRSTRGEYVLFLGHARGSNCEVQTQLVIAKHLGFGEAETQENVTGLADEVGRMLVAMIATLRR